MIVVYKSWLGLLYYAKKWYKELNVCGHEKLIDVPISISILDALIVVYLFLQIQSIFNHCSILKFLYLSLHLIVWKFDKAKSLILFLRNLFVPSVLVSFCKFSNNLSIKSWNITKGCFLYLHFYPFWRKKKIKFLYQTIFHAAVFCVLGNRSCITRFGKRKIDHKKSKIMSTHLNSITLMIIMNTTL